MHMKHDTSTILLYRYSEATKHLERVSTERDFYKSACEQSRQQLRETYETLPLLTDPPRPCNLQFHISFDFAQQVC